MMPRSKSSFRWFQPSVLLNIPECAHPIVKAIFKLMVIERVTLVWLAKTTGITREAISAWRRISSPKLANIEAALNAFGYQLVIRPMTDSNGNEIPLVPVFLERAFKNTLSEIANGGGVDPRTAKKIKDFI